MKLKQYQIYGLIGGFGIVLTSIFAGKYESLRLLPVIFYIGCVYLSIKKSKEIEYEGFLTVKNGVKAGVLAALIACIFYGVYIFISATWEDPRPEVYEMFRQGMTRKEIAFQLSFVNKTVLAQGSAIYTIFTFFIGFFSSVVAALFLRKSRGLIGQD